MRDLLTNKVDQLKASNYSRFFDEPADRDVNPNRSYYASPKFKGKVDPLATGLSSIDRRKTYMGSTYNTLSQVNELDDPVLRSRVERMAELKLKDKLRDMNAAYHHHFHNAIVGMNDADTRYNSKAKLFDHQASQT